MRNMNYSAKDAAINMLSRRDHGHYEMRQKLLNKGFELADIDSALQFCSEHHYLDDLRYAKSQVRQHVFKGHGELRIRQELLAKRVPESVIAHAFTEEPQDWFELAKLLAEKKYQGVKSQDAKEYAKQVRFMQYRGFSFEQIQYAFEFNPLDS